jgi:uncharacterized repeat protein (TIGR03803 family)
VTAKIQYRLRLASPRATVAVLVGVVAIAAGLGSGLAQAQTFTTLYNFTGGTDGGSPYLGHLVLDKGNVYGNAANGGDTTCDSSFGCGVVFKITPTGSETVIHTFTGPDGAEPSINLLSNGAGGGYGVTEYGGSGPCNGFGQTPNGCGAVFELNSRGNESVFYSFLGAPDGRSPSPGLIKDAAGNLYGTTALGGASNLGTVFEVDASGNETVLYSFSGTDGEYPEAGVIEDAAGNLYGTTWMGGAYGDGVLFKLTKTGKETVLHSFGEQVGDGQEPFAGVVADAAGNLYGTTVSGGASGYGAVYKLTRKTGEEAVLYSLAGPPGDGSDPYAEVVLDSQGNIYGTTLEGGEFGDGAVFELEATGVEILLHSFDGTDGKRIYGGLVRDAAGNLYGTTLSGGAFESGSVFKLVP